MVIRFIFKSRTLPDEADQGVDLIPEEETPC